LVREKIVTDSEQSELQPVPDLALPINSPEDVLDRLLIDADLSRDFAVCAPGDNAAYNVALAWR